MPIIEIAPDAILPERTNYDLQLERDPTFSELAKANLENENLMNVGARKLSDKTNSFLNEVQS